MQGVLNVAGQTRLQESAWLAQLAKQASLVASATRSRSLREAVPAVAVPINAKNNATHNRGFIRTLRQMLSVEGARQSASNHARRWRACSSSASALLIINSSILWPVLSAATSQRGCLPRPDQVSEGSLGFRYFG